VTPANIVAACYVKGIFHSDRAIFRESDFLSSFVTDTSSEMLQEQEPMATNKGQGRKSLKQIKQILTI
jgi:hypothetical protein